MRIIRNGDLKNLTITLQDLIKDNSTGSGKNKRSAYQIPSRQIRSAEAIVNVATSAAPTHVPAVTEAGISSSVEPIWESVDIIPITPYSLHSSRGISYEVHVRFLDFWCSSSHSLVLNIFSESVHFHLSLFVFPVYSFRVHGFSWIRFHFAHFCNLLW